MGGRVDRRRIREQEDWAPKELQGDVGSAKLARHEVNMCRVPLCSSTRGNEYMLKSFHLGHVHEACADAFSRTRRRSETKVVQRAKHEQKNTSQLIVSPRNIETR